MATFTLKSNVFPDGTTVKLYPKSNWPTPGSPSGAPVGAPTVEAAMSGPTVFSGLTDGIEYWAVAQVGGVYRYLSVLAGADAAASTSQSKGIAIFNGTSWPNRPAGFTSVEWQGPAGAGKPGSANDTDTLILVAS